ncbi:MAG: RNA methyltransferase [Eubacterium sp.]|nr:RNA methyltransferase [Eubacterium sp.]
MIISKDNQRIKHIRQLLGSKKTREADRLFVIEGRKPVDEAIREGLVEEVYVSEDYEGEVPDDAQVVGAKLFKDITDTVTPQGILAIVRMPKFDRESVYAGADCKLICLEDVRDPGNVGTVIRTAEAAGFDAVVLSEECADIFQPKVVRSTMGSILRVPCFRCGDRVGTGSVGAEQDRDSQETLEKKLRGFDIELAELKRRGFTLYAAHLEGAVDYTEPKYAGKTAILIGNEARGLTDRVTECADVAVKIPMFGKVESLNASVAAAVLMFNSNRN